MGASGADAVLDNRSIADKVRALPKEQREAFMQSLSTAEKQTLLFDWNFFEYRMLVAGISYLLIGYAFAKNEKAPLSGFLYSFGILGFLGAAFALGGWSPTQNVFWELIFPGLALGTLFMSVYLKTRSFLTFGSLFLMIYILKITGEYFTSGLGWPLSLVLAGLMLIAVGYLYVYLKKKYSLV